MTSEDVEAAEAAAWAALGPLWPSAAPSTPEAEVARSARLQRRLAHLLETDPGGGWVARATVGEIVGVASAFVRERLWGLSLLAVMPGWQGAGIGVRLLDAALGCAEKEMAQLIVSSHDPRALRLYHRAGLKAHPSLDASGAVNRSRIPAGLRSVAGDPSADAERIEAIGRHVRGAGYGPDIGVAVETGCRLLVYGDDGFALERDGEPYLVAARSEAVARDLTWSCLALAEPGATVFLPSIIAGNDWAIGVALDAGFSLSTSGAVFSRNVRGTLAPYLPSGGYL
jgi:GNAT superfamily N-acetyltransferase